MLILLPYFKLETLVLQIFMLNQQYPTVFLLSNPSGLQFICLDTVLLHVITTCLMVGLGLYRSVFFIVYILFFIFQILIYNGEVDSGFVVCCGVINNELCLFLQIIGSGMKYSQFHYYCYVV